MGCAPQTSPSAVFDNRTGATGRRPVQYPAAVIGLVGGRLIADPLDIAQRLAPATKVDTMYVACRSSDPRPRS